MQIIGLTGGIGSGKSTVAGLFFELGIPIIDADKIAHSLTVKGSKINAHIREIWRDDVVSSEGELNRTALRTKVFSNPDELEKLEALLHPAIRSAMLEKISRHRAEALPYCILEVPLLFEKGFNRMVDKVIVVDLPEALQIERVQTRSGLSCEEIERIIKKQIDRASRLKRADYVIDNALPQETLASRVSILHEKITGS